MPRFHTKLLLSLVTVFAGCSQGSEPKAQTGVTSSTNSSVVKTNPGGSSDALPATGVTPTTSTGAASPLSPASTASAAAAPTPTPALSAAAIRSAALTQPAATCGGLKPGESLTTVAGGRTTMPSCNGSYELIMQTDGNLVLYSGTLALWATATGGSTGQTAIMQTDGNFVLYDNANKPLWATNTSGLPNAILAVQDDSNLVVYTSNNKPVWTWNNGILPLHACGTLASGDSLTPNPLPNSFLNSCDGAYRLTMRGDGSLAVTQGANQIWTSGTTGHSGSRLIMNNDGNLFIQDPSGNTVWMTLTIHSPGASLVIQSDGNAVIYATGGAPVWASKTGLVPVQCTALAAFANQPTDATGALQTCINNTPTYAVLEIPYAVFQISSPILITQPLTLRTQGSYGQVACYDVPGNPGAITYEVTGNRTAAPCAMLVATNHFSYQPQAYGDRGQLIIRSTSNVTIDHIALNGNYTGLISQVAYGGVNGLCRLDAANLKTPPPTANSVCGIVDVRGSSNVTFSNGAILEGVGDHVFSVRADSAGTHSKYFSFINNAFINSGRTYGSVVPDGSQPFWGDALEFEDLAVNPVVTGNYFQDNTDGNIVFNTYETDNGYINNNTIRAKYQQTVSGIVLVSQPSPNGVVNNEVCHGGGGDYQCKGEYTGTIISGNFVDCKSNPGNPTHSYCEFGIILGAQPWAGNELPAIWGFTLDHNAVNGAGRGIQLANVKNSVVPTAITYNQTTNTPATFNSFLRNVIGGNTGVGNITGLGFAWDSSSNFNGAATETGLVDSANGSIGGNPGL